jgi:ABC-type polysaccharide/polyol phosphate export permease
MYSQIWNSRKLIQFLVKGQIEASVHRTALGNIWYSLVPLSQILIYYFLIVIVFNTGDPSNNDSLLVILIGLMHYLSLTHVGSYSLPAIYNNSMLLLQVKLEPIVLIAAGYYRTIRLSLINVVIALVGFVSFGGKITMRLLFYPLILLAWACLVWSISIFTAVCAVYIRDLEKLYPIIIQIFMYLSGVVYTVLLFPQSHQWLLILNPIACIFALLQWSFLGVDISIREPIIVLAIVIPLSLLGAQISYLLLRHNFTKAF